VHTTRAQLQEHPDERLSFNPDLKTRQIVATTTPAGLLRDQHFSLENLGLGMIRGTLESFIVTVMQHRAIR
jgi:hypothetical protein